MGDDPAADEPLLVDGLDKTALPMAVISDDGRWLALHVHLMPTRTDVILLDRETGARTVMVEGEEASTWVQIVGGRIYAVTNLGCPPGTGGLGRPRPSPGRALGDDRPRVGRGRPAR